MQTTAEIQNILNLEEYDRLEESFYKGPLSDWSGKQLTALKLNIKPSFLTYILTHDVPNKYWISWMVNNILRQDGFNFDTKSIVDVIIKSLPTTITQLIQDEYLFVYGNNKNIRELRGYESRKTDDYWAALFDAYLSAVLPQSLIIRTPLKQRYLDYIKTNRAELLPEIIKVFDYGFDKNSDSFLKYQSIKVTSQLLPDDKFLEPVLHGSVKLNADNILELKDMLNIDEKLKFIEDNINKTFMQQYSVKTTLITIIEDEALTDEQLDKIVELAKKSVFYSVVSPKILKQMTLSQIKSLRIKPVNEVFARDVQDPVARVLRLSEDNDNLTPAKKRDFYESLQRRVFMKDEWFQEHLDIIDLNALALMPFGYVSEDTWNKIKKATRKRKKYPEDVFTFEAFMGTFQYTLNNSLKTWDLFIYICEATKAQNSQILLNFTNTSLLDIISDHPLYKFLEGISQ